MARDVEAEIRDPKRRVSEIEGSFGFLTEQIKGVHKDLLAFEARTDERFDKTDKWFDKVDGRFDTVDGRLDRVERGIRGLREEMPAIVGDAMRTVLREDREKPRK
jgi:hypothetical protein